jgi:MFS family permease
MDLFIRIPYKKQSDSGSIAQIIKSDISLSVKFAVKDKPMLAKGAIVIFLFTVLIASIFMVGLPVLITQHLLMGMEFVGICQSIMMAGGIAGAVAAGAMGTKLTIPKSLAFVAVGSALIVPIGLALLLDMPSLAAYLIITVASALVLFVLQLFNIAAITFVQEVTPSALIGKILSILMVLPFLAYALGQLLYGVLFERLEAAPWIIVFATALLSVVISLYSRNYFKRTMYMESGPDNGNVEIH